MNRSAMFALWLLLAALLAACSGETPGTAPAGDPAVATAAAQFDLTRPPTPPVSPAASSINAAGEPTIEALPTEIPEPIEEEVAAGTEDPLADWPLFDGDGIELRLPPTFIGGDPAQELPAILDAMRTAGSEFEAVAQSLEADPGQFIFWAFDSQSGDQGFLTNVNSTRGQISQAITLDQYLTLVAESLPEQWQIEETGVVAIDGREAARLVVEYNLPGNQGKQLAFTFIIDDTIWTVTYSTDIEELAARRTAFEQSAATIVIRP